MVREVGKTFMGMVGLDQSKSGEVVPGPLQARNGRTGSGADVRVIFEVRGGSSDGGRIDWKSAGCRG